jgi:hypothetical protein
MYWTATSTFHVGACGVESAADGYGYSRNDVVAAFNAFGDLPVSNKANARRAGRPFLASSGNGGGTREHLARQRPCSTKWAARDCSPASLAEQ